MSGTSTRHKAVRSKLRCSLNVKHIENHRYGGAYLRTSLHPTRRVQGTNDIAFQPINSAPPLLAQSLHTLPSSDHADEPNDISYGNSRFCID
jgi:hypothetical protein